MNYIKQLNAFYDLLQSNQLNSSTQLLYHVLLMVNNKCGWLEWFQRTNQSLCGLIGVNEKTLVASRNMLKQKGLIDFIPAKKKGEITKYKVIKIYYEREDMGEEKTVQNTPNVTSNITPNVTPITGPQTTDIYKHKLNENQNIYDISCCSINPSIQSIENRDIGSGTAMEEAEAEETIVEGTIGEGAAAGNVIAAATERPITAVDVAGTVKTNAIYFYEKNIARGRIGEFLRNQILNAVYQYGDSLVLHALERTVLQIDNPNWRYANKILMTWAEKGIKTIEQAKNEQKLRNTTSIVERDNGNNASDRDAGNGRIAQGNPTKLNKFLNFPQTKYNFEEIEKLEMEQMIKKYEKMKSVGEV